MSKKFKVLWIEDNARNDLTHFVAPVYMDGGYDLHIVEDASSAISYVKETKCQAIIVDIRILPGEDEKWRDLWAKDGETKTVARLGRHLLYTLLKHPDAKIKDVNIPSWITQNKIGVFTIESEHELEVDFEKLGISIEVYHQKTAQSPETILLDLIKKIIRQSNRKD